MQINPQSPIKLKNIKIFPIKDKLIIFLSIYTVFIFSLCIYSNYYANSFETLFITSLNNSEKIFDIEEKLATIKYYTSGYLSSGSYESLNYYLRFSNELNEVLDGIYPDLSKGGHHILLSNMKNMAKSYLEETMRAVNAKRVQEQVKYEAYLTNSQKIYELMQQNSIELLTEIQKSTSEDYKQSKQIQRTIKIYLSITILSVIVFAYAFTFLFAGSITKPLDEIKAVAENISMGNFSNGNIEVETRDELAVISDAFNKMSGNISELIEEIKEKADIEKRLHEEENKNLAVQNLLKDAEYKALQAQLNPHFLFNTLNVIAQTSMMEEADKTTVLIKAISAILRYNLKNFEIPVTLREEMDSINRYIYIMKARFGNKINFEVKVDECLLDTIIPRMIIQPLIENSVIHGFNSDLLKSLKIDITILEEDKHMVIRVKDNGVGFEKRILENVLNRGDENIGVHKGHTTGIGLGNIIGRLKMLYADEEVISIYSRPMEGSEIIIRLPTKHMKEESNV